MATTGLKFSRWEIGDQPQRPGVGVTRRDEFSRWEIGDQPQQMPSTTLDEL